MRSALKSWYHASFFLILGPLRSWFYEKQTVEEIKKILPEYPIFGICLGHQLLGLAHDCKVKKLKFGNNDVKKPKTGNSKIKKM